MGKVKTTKCAYSECMLPDNNAKFLVQTVYMLISILFLFKDAKGFTFFAMLMYTAPILIDLVYVKMNNIIFKTTRILFIVFNIAILVFCILGLSSFILDYGDNFTVVDTALLCANLSIAKSKLVFPLMVELLVPFSLYIGSPHKSTKKALEFVQKEVLR